MKSLGVLLTIMVFIFSLSVSTVLAQPCEGNFDCDQDVDGTDASVFKVDFGRSPFFHPCPNCPPPAEVPKTGQLVVYGPRDDGYWQQAQGITWPDPRFTNIGDGTVRDNLTGLIWLRNANCFSQRTWDEALSDANGLEDGACGLTDGSSWGDWRLPNIKELQSLIDFGNYAPALPTGHPFVNVLTLNYWSSTTSDNNPDYAWYLYMNGVVALEIKHYEYFVWPVRGGHFD